MADTPAIWLPPFQVNVLDKAQGAGGSNRQSGPFIAALPDGGAVIVWEDSGARCFFEPADVAFRRLDVAGARVGAEQPCVNSALDYAQLKLSYQPLANGTGYVLYQRDDFMFGEDVWFDLVDADGQPVTAGNPFHFVVTMANEGAPTGAVLTSGAFAIAYTNDAANGSFDLSFDVVPNPISAPATHIGESLLFDAAVEAQDPAMAPLSNGNFVVAYVDFNGGAHKVRIAIGKSDGTVVSIADPAVESAAGDIREPAVTALNGGGFVVSWADPDGDGAGNKGIRARLYSNAGVPAGPAFAVNATTAGVQTEPALAPLAAGFLAAWADQNTGRIKIRKFDGAGTPKGSEIELAVPNAVASEPSLSRLADGRTAVAFTAVKSGNANVWAAILDDRDAPTVGTVGDDTLTAVATGGGVSGLSGADALYGSPNNDSLDGGPGPDEMKGGRGSDIYTVDDPGDVVVEALGQGLDTVRSSISYCLFANVETLQLLGTGNIAGFGSPGPNRIFGNAGKNELKGRGGQDIVAGGPGNDTFDFAADPVAGNHTTVNDFQTGDVLKLFRSAMPALPAGSVLPASAFTLGTAAASADHRIIYAPSTGALLYDPDGTGPTIAVQIGTLRGGPALTPAQIRLL